METNPLQRYNKKLEYAREIVKLCIESAFFLHLVAWGDKITTHSRMRVRCGIFSLPFREGWG